MLPIPGVDLPGVITFRDLADVEAMLAAAKRGRKRRGDRRRPAGARSRERPALARHGRHGRAPVRHADGAAARCRGRCAAARLAREPRHSRSRCRRRPPRSSATNPCDGVRFNGRQRDSRRSRRDGGGRAPEHRRSRAPPACDANAACSSTTRCRLTTRASTRSASAFSIATSRSVSSRRCGNRRASARRISPSSACRAIAARCSPTQLKVTGIELYSAGDFQGQRARRRHRAARSRPAGLQASHHPRQQAARRRAVRRCQRRARGTSR